MLKTVRLATVLTVGNALHQPAADSFRATLIEIVDRDIRTDLLVQRQGVTRSLTGAGALAFHVVSHFD